jgi:hypothetical protein
MVENYREVLYDNARLETERLILRKATKNDAVESYVLKNLNRTVLNHYITPGTKVQEGLCKNAE